MAQDAGVEPGGACQRFQAQNEEFIILEERQQGHMQGHVQRDDAFPFARLPRKTGHQVDGTPVEHRHGQQQWDKGHARERIKKEIADEQKRPVFPRSSQPATRTNRKKVANSSVTKFICAYPGKRSCARARDLRTIAKTHAPCKQTASAFSPIRRETLAFSKSYRGSSRNTAPRLSR
jgi:hypothetical protein